MSVVLLSGADPGFEKGGGAGGSGACPRDFFGQFKGLFKEFGAKRGGRVPTLWICAYLWSINIHVDSF